MVDTPVTSPVTAIQSRLALEMPRWLTDDNGHPRVQLTALAVLVHAIAQETARRELAVRYQLLADRMRRSNTVGMPPAVAVALDRWADSIARRAAALRQNDNQTRAAGESS
jgi:hypothetical protein